MINAHQTKEEIGSLPEKEFRTVIVKMIQNLENKVATRLLHPWDFPGKSTGVGCLLQFKAEYYLN